MKRTFVLLALALLPAAAGAQELDRDRLRDALPEGLAERVMERMDAADQLGVPSHPVAMLAREGVAKGRNADQVLSAVDALLAEMGQARGALVAGGHEPMEGEVEAATAAMRMGVDAGQVSELARAGASGRTLSVPLLVLGGLTDRGLPSDQALAAVRDRLAAGMDDGTLVAEAAERGLALGHGTRPGHTGPGSAVGPNGFKGPFAGIMVPVGPQGDRPRPGRRPGGE